MPEPTSFPQRRRAAALVLVLAAATAPARGAFAQTSGEKAAAAQALFDEAMRLLRAGQAAEACPKLEESQRLDAGMATQFRLAECYEKMGKLASAWASFVAVADSAAVARLVEREAAARARAQALAPRLARLTLTLPPAVAALDGVDVQRDGSPVGRALWGVPVPVDPGEHRVTVRAPGKKPWAGSITTESTAGTVTLAVPPLEDLPREAPPPAPRPARARSSVPAIVLGAVAAVAEGAGVALFLVHSSQKASATSTSAQIKTAHGTCAPGAAAPSTLCGTLANQASSSDTFGNLSTVAFVTGSAAAVAMVGYLLWPAGPQARAGANRIRVAPAVGAGRLGLMAGGSF